MKTEEIKLPEMTVEADRTPTSAHGITPPNIDKDHLWKQIEETLLLNEQAKVDIDDFTDMRWQSETLDILKKYIPFDVEDSEIINSVQDVCGHSSWKEVSKFVIDDECFEFFNMALKYCKKEGQPHTTNKGFIDGSGLGYAKKYWSNAKKAIEKCFDAKYYFETPRPLRFIHDETGMNLTTVANAIHPGHWAYPAGHGTKFLVAVQTLNEVFRLDKGCLRMITIAACVEAMGRSGNLIHYPQDNLAGGSLTTLSVFKK